MILINCIWRKKRKEGILRSQVLSSCVGLIAGLYKSVLRDMADMATALLLGVNDPM